MFCEPTQHLAELISTWRGILSVKLKTGKIPISKIQPTITL